MPVIQCKMQTKHDKRRHININFQNLHKISKNLAYRNPVNRFVHHIRPISYSTNAPKSRNSFEGMF